MPTDTELPRILLLTSVSFNRVNGGGITLGNLFQGWSRDRLAMAHCDSVPPTDEICNLYFELGPNEIRRLGPFLGMAPVVASSAPQGRLSALRRMFVAGKRLVFGNMFPDTGRLSRELERWIGEFRPDVLYTILGSNAMMDLTLAIHRRFGIPIAIHFMDDWQATVYRGGALSFAARRRMRRLVRATVGAAGLRLGISPAMCREYQRRFGVPFQAFMNAINVSRYGRIAESSTSRPHTKEVLYVGSVLPHGQLGSLVDCCHAVARLADRGVRLTILTSAAYLKLYRDALAIAPNITVGESPPDGPEFIRLIESASVLLLPVNFDHESVSFIRYSLPTKVPAYLASGTPILAYGPDAVAQIAYAREEGWAHVVSERDMAKLTDGIDRLVHDEAVRAIVSERALRLATLRHDLSVVQHEFERAMAGLTAE